MTTQNSENIVHTENRLELLLFHLSGNQRFAINVLKVSAVIPCPPLTKLPDSHPSICGVATLRGESIAVLDLSQAIGRSRTADEDIHNCSVIVTEINRSKQGLLVDRVDRIIIRDWKDVSPPPKGLGTRSYASGVTRFEEALTQILDVERILGEINHTPIMINENFSNNISNESRGLRLLIVDDSSMARSQISKTLDQLQLQYITATDGKEALELLKKTNANDADSSERIDFVLSDIEMPEMDGYSLTKEIRQDSQLSDLYILLHTSLNGTINTERAKQCGANAFLTKFVPDELANEIIKGLQKCSTDVAV